MTIIYNNISSPKELLRQRLILKSMFQPRVRKLLNEMTTNTFDLLLAGNKPNPDKIANLYEEKFVVLIQNIMLASVKRFGFNLRSSLQQKYNMNFNIEKQIHNLLLKRKIPLNQASSDNEKTDEQKIEEINDEINSLSKKFIEKTAINKASKIKKKNLQIVKEQVRDFVAFDSVEIPQEVLNKLERISRNRSSMIAEDIVGTSQSWSRYTEASVINQSGLTKPSGSKIGFVKIWDSTLDSRTRASHVLSDGQEKPVDEPFIVGGEHLKYPRDEAGSSENIINCRCEAIYLSP